MAGSSSSRARRSITVRGDPGLGELYRARFAGPVPRMRVRGGVVTVAYPRFGWFDWRAQVAGQHIDASAHWRKDTGEIALNSAVPWAIELRGGVSQWTADLRSIRLESFELAAGRARSTCSCPGRPGVVPITDRGRHEPSLDRAAARCGRRRRGPRRRQRGRRRRRGLQGPGQLSVQTPGRRTPPRTATRSR